MPDPLSDFLRGLRMSRHRSLRDVAREAGLAPSTLSHWESGAHQPRLPELTAVLEILKASPAERHQALALVRAPRALNSPEDANNSPGIPPPSIGDVLRAMRLRRGWTQEQTAGSIGVQQSTVVRWERSELLPSAERWTDLFRVLKAQPEEQAILRGGTVSLAPAAPTVRKHSDLDRWEMELQGIHQHTLNHPLDPLLNLRYLVHEARLWPLFGISARARVLFARGEVYFASCLLTQRHWEEAKKRAERALSLFEAESRPAKHWVWALEYLGRATAQGRYASPRRATELLRNNLSLLDEFPREERLIHSSYLHRAIAAYLCDDLQPQAALAAIEAAREASLQAGHHDEAGCNTFEMSRILRANGAPDRAAALLGNVANLLNPRLLYAPSRQLTDLFEFVEVYFALGEYPVVEALLRRVFQVLKYAPIEPFRSQTNRYVERLDLRSPRRTFGGR